MRVLCLAAAMCALHAAPADTSVGRRGFDDPPRPHCSVAITGTEDADTLIGGARSDRLSGLGGDDRLKGKGGRDCIGGGAGNDRLLGGGDGDQLNGGPGRDRLYGGFGDDRLRAARGGRDHVDCGTGEDVATINVLEDEVRGCELVKTP